jgi:hypothetical protein
MATTYYIKLCCENANNLFTSSLFQLLLTFLGAFLGFGFSLWLYYKENKRDKKKEENQKKQHYIDLLKYYKELLSLIIGALEKQLTLIDEFVLKQKENLTVLVPLNQIATEDFTRLKNIDNRGTFEAWIYTFKTDDNIKQYKTTNSALDFLEGTRLEIDRIYQTNTKHCYEQLMQAKQIIDHIPDRLASIAHQMAQDLGEDRWQNDIYKTINSYFKVYAELTTDIADFEQINDKYLSPLLEIFLKEYKDFMYSDEITMLCKKARVKLQDVRFEMENIISELGKTRERSARSISIINTAINKINDLTISE